MQEINKIEINIRYNDAINIDRYIIQRDTAYIEYRYMVLRIFKKLKTTLKIDDAFTEQKAM